MSIKYIVESIMAMAKFIAAASVGQVLPSHLLVSSEQLRDICTTGKETSCTGL